VESQTSLRTTEVCTFRASVTSHGVERLDFVAITGFTGPIYTNPSLSLYEAFGLASGLHRPPADKPKRDYIQSGYLAGALKSIAVRPSITYEHKRYLFILSAFHSISGQNVLLGSSKATRRRIHIWSRFVCSYSGLLLGWSNS
jgi:hypothetical protein